MLRRYLLTASAVFSISSGCAVATQPDSGDYDEDGPAPGAEMPAAEVQSMVVEGTVTDAVTDLPITTANVCSFTTRNCATVDDDGRFRLDDFFVGAPLPLLVFGEGYAGVVVAPFMRDGVGELSPKLVSPELWEEFGGELGPLQPLVGGVIVRASDPSGEPMEGVQIDLDGEGQLVYADAAGAADRALEETTRAGWGALFRNVDAQMLTVRSPAGKTCGFYVESPEMLVPWMTVHATSEIVTLDVVCVPEGSELGG